MQNKKAKTIVLIIAPLIAITLGLIMFSIVLYYYPVRHMELIRYNSGQLDNSLILAVIHAESKFKPEARSSKNAVGLMQVTETTAEWVAGLMLMEDYHPSYLTDPAINIAIGCFYLNWLMNYFDGDTHLAISAYNAGQGNVNRWLADERFSIDGITLDAIPFPETEQYVKRVNDNKKIYDVLLFVVRGQG